MINEKDLGQLKIQKGGTVEVSNGEKSKEIRLEMLDAIPECRKDKCLLAPQCPYPKKGRCKVRLHYVVGKEKFFHDNAAKLDELTMCRIGQLLLPLYDQLCRFQMEQLVIETVDTHYNRVHPIFATVRATIKDIFTVEKNLQLEKKLGVPIVIKPVGDLLNPNR